MFKRIICSIMSIAIITTSITPVVSANTDPSGASPPEVDQVYISDEFVFDDLSHLILTEMFDNYQPSPEANAASSTPVMPLYP